MTNNSSSSVTIQLPVGGDSSSTTTTSSMNVVDIVPKFSTPPPQLSSTGAPPDSFQSAEQEFSNTYDIILGTSLVASFSLYRVFNFLYRAVTFQVVLEPTEATNEKEEPTITNHLQGFRKLFSNEGISGFFRGFPARMLKKFFHSYVVRNVLVSVDLRREFLLAKRGDLITQRTIPSYQLIYQGTSLLGDIFSYPWDTVFVRMQASRSHRIAHPTLRDPTGSIDCMNKIIRKEGFRALYRGWYLKLIQRVVRFASLAGSYRCLQLFFGLFGLGDDSVADGSDQAEEILDSIMFIMAELVSRFTVQPLKILRRRLQYGVLSEDEQSVERVNIVKCAKEIYDKEGWLGFYKGSVYQYSLGAIFNK
ncbi:predicted protein [Naegleria gruberi]|uniref:Predicted protein n=1 Tax=Naegleria gruberi TaxID=5762 RepID=D2UZ00_NAEGR|nr:uncharacterized protein NAEGRDRAFT_61764 [Naegleria gruberi]EFC50061.1 predicted protein [Naegleria gruberi]|eukprot:XP_002682805.1 predicted protein [Naegleria gruberi strain NEG-M]